MRKLTALMLCVFISLNTAFAASIDKKKATEEVQERVDYAFKVSGENARFVYLLESENSSWQTDTRSGTWYWCYDKPTKKWKKCWDYGICQVSEKWHPEIVFDENFKDWKWQIDKCWYLYRTGTTFYGNWWKVKNRFTITK